MLTKRGLISARFDCHRPATSLFPAGADVTYLFGEARRRSFPLPAIGRPVSSQSLHHQKASKHFTTAINNTYRPHARTNTLTPVVLTPPHITRHATHHARLCCGNLAPCRGRHKQPSPQSRTDQTLIHTAGHCARAGSGPLMPTSPRTVTEHTLRRSSSTGTACRIHQHEFAFTT